MQKIFNLVLILVVFYLVFNKVYTSEKMSNTDIKNIIQKEYKIDVDAIRNLSKLANELTVNNKLIVPGGLEIMGPLKVNKDVNISGKTTISKDLKISGNTTIRKKITTKGGGDFSGGRYYFTDSERCGKLRVGCAWGKPGIYAENRKHLILGSSAGQVQFQGNSSRIIGKNAQFSNVMSTGERNNYMRTRERNNYMRTSERGNYNRKDQTCIYAKSKSNRNKGSICIYNTGFSVQTGKRKVKWYGTR